MEIKILCPVWGHEHDHPADLFSRAKDAGYDGIDGWLPDDLDARKTFIRSLRQAGLPVVVQQYRAEGNSIGSYCRSFEYQLQQAMEAEPILINSHSGTDAMSVDEQLAVIDTASQFEAQNNIVVAHETHRGRIGYSPAAFKYLVTARPSMHITADFSHWVCVTESFLEHHEETVALAISRTAHIHARVGHTQGPQVSDPDLPRWQAETNFFMKLWSRIISHDIMAGKKLLTVTPEFGPPPYMDTDATGKPLGNQWELNVMMMNRLRNLCKNITDKIAALLLATIFISGAGKVRAQVTEPYRPLHGGSYTGKANPYSPDPLVRYRWNNGAADDSLQIYTMLPKSFSIFPATSFKLNGSSIAVNGNGDLMMDFGVVSAGWLEFDIDVSLDLPAELTASISEHREPAILNKGAQHPVKTLKPVRYGNTYRLELNDMLYEGVRFAWIHIKGFKKSFTIKNPRLICQTKPANYLGSFYSNDTMLNRIWATGAYVVKLNLLQNFLGAILMERSDRHSWTGDAYPSQAASLAAFGNFDFVKKNIAFTAPQNNGIASYSMYWVLGLVDYYNYTGDADFFRQQVANASARLNAAFEHFDSLPKLVFMGWDERLGAGFERPNLPESERAYRWLCINAWSAFSKALVSAGDNTELAKRFADFAKTKTKQLLADEKQLSNYGVHAISELVNALPGDTVLSSLLVRDQILQQYNDLNQRLSYSPFNQYFIIQGMSIAGAYEQAIRTIHDQWGGQIKYGGTTFFEVFRPSWNDALAPNSAPVNNQCGYTSLAHPWGAGVVRWLSEEVLGVKPAEPGFRKIEIKPHLTSQLNQVSGELPTPFGIVSVSFNIDSGEASMVIPVGATVSRLAIPTAGKAVTGIVMNHQKISAASQDDEFLYFENIAAGSYEFRLSYANGSNLKSENLKSRHVQSNNVNESVANSNTTSNIRSSVNRKSAIKESAIADLRYVITKFETGNTTGKKFGELGKLSPGLSKKENIIIKPAFIDSVISSLEGYQSWDLQGKTINAFVTRDPLATLQTFTTDIYSKPGQSFYITIQFTDPDNKGRRSAIEIFDLNDLSILAPVKLIEQYQSGKYIRFKVDRPVRIRVNHVRGPNAAVSGFYFDEQ